MAATPPQQTDPAEGPRQGEPADKADAVSVPTQPQPAEGGDDTPAGGSNSPT